jgi:hypothetical protein
MLQQEGRLKDLLQDVVESKEFEGYLVARDGRVFSTRRYGPCRAGLNLYKGRAVRELKYHIGRSRRYLEVNLIREGKRCRVRVHRLVAEVYLPQRPFNEAVIRHLDGNAFNNCYENLVWGSRQDDANDRVLLGTTAKGGRNGSAKLREEEVIEMRRRYWCGDGTLRLSDEFGISQRHARDVIFGRYWKHV